MDIKNKLNEIINECNLLMEELSYTKNEQNESGIDINFQGITNAAAKIKYENPVLESLDDGLKYLYIRLLLLLFKNTEHTQLEIILLHVEKIRHAMGISMNLETEYINSHKTDAQAVYQIITEISKMSEIACQMLVMDLITILVSADIRDEKLCKDTAAIISKLGLNTNQIKQEFELAKCIVSHDVTTYKQFVNNNLDISLPDLYPYIAPIKKGVLSSSTNLAWVNGSVSFAEILKLGDKKGDINRDERKAEACTLSSEELIFENTDIELSSPIKINSKKVTFYKTNVSINTFSFDFSGCNTILFKECNFKKISKYLEFLECENIIWDSCEFEGTDSVKCFEMLRCKNIKITNCSFENFTTHEKNERRYAAYYGCFLINDAKNVSFENNKFRKCLTKHWETGDANYAVGGVYGTHDIKFVQCEFNECKNEQWQYGSTWRDIGYMFRFGDGVKINMNGNTFNNCVEVEKSSNKNSFGTLFNFN